MAPPAEPGNGRERLGLKIGGQSVDLATGNLVQIILIALIGVGGYLLYIAVDRRLEHLREVQVHIIDKLDHHESADRQEQQALYAWRETQIDYLRRLLITMDYNLGRAPADRLPLELLPPPVAPVPKE